MTGSQRYFRPGTVLSIPTLGMSGSDKFAVRARDFVDPLVDHYRGAELLRAFHASPCFEPSASGW